jgi:hypothetical protein
MKRSSELFKETKTAKEKEKSAKRSVNLIAQDTSPSAKQFQKRFQHILR